MNDNQGRFEHFEHLLCEFAKTVRHDALDDLLLRLHEYCKDTPQTESIIGNSSYATYIIAEYQIDTLLDEIKFILHEEGINMRGSSLEYPLVLLERKAEELFNELPLSSKFAFFLGTKSNDFRGMADSETPNVIDAWLLQAHEDEDYHFPVDYQITEEKIANTDCIISEIAEQFLDSISSHRIYRLGREHHSEI